MVIQTLRPADRDGRLDRAIRVMLLFGLLSLAIRIDSAAQGPTFNISTASICLGSGAAGAPGERPLQCDIALDYDQSLTRAASIRGTFGAEGRNHLLAVAHADARPGIFRTSTSEQFSLPGAPGVAYSAGVAIMREFIRVDFAPWNGSLGYMRLRYTLSGRNSAMGAARSLALVTGSVGDFGEGGARSFEAARVNGEFEFPQVFRFVYGQWFSLDFSLTSISGTVDAYPQYWLERAASGQGSGSSDFDNTLVLSGFEFFDPAMNPIEGATITSASGTPYTSNGVGLTVSIDVRPKTIKPARIRPHRNGELQVALLSTSDFDAPASIDQTAITFGRLGTEHSLKSCFRARDVNGDGRKDLICRFSEAQAGFQGGDLRAVLRATTRAGVPVVGDDAVRVAVRKQSKHIHDDGDDAR